MLKAIKILGIVLSLNALVPLSLFAVTEIHISPSGQDSHPGTASLPVASPIRARELVRGLIAAGLNDSVDVIFASGTYQLAAPLELHPEDSGTEAFPITWKAATGAQVILIGGKKSPAHGLTGEGGVWYTDLTGIGLGAGQLNFRQLFVNGSRATRARFPNKSQANPFLYATGGAFDHAIIAPSLIKPFWGSGADT